MVTDFNGPNASLGLSSAKQSG